VKDNDRALFCVNDGFSQAFFRGKVLIEIAAEYIPHDNLVCLAHYSGLLSGNFAIGWPK
jgi:hypothetical protein